MVAEGVQRGEAVVLDPSIVELKKHLLTLGGARFQFDEVLARDIEPGLARVLVDEGTVSKGGRARLLKGESNQCHRNAAENVESHPGWSWETGFALSKDGIWRVHAWNRDETGRIVETTVRRTLYYGIDITQDPSHRPDPLVQARELIWQIVARGADLAAEGLSREALGLLAHTIEQLGEPLLRLLLLRATVLGELQRAPEGLRDAAATLALAESDDQRALCLEARASLLWEIGDFDACADTVDEALALDLPGDARSELVVGRARIEMRRGRPEGALEVVTLALPTVSAGSRAELLEIGAVAALEVGRYAEATAFVDEVLAIVHEPSERAQYLELREAAAAARDGR